MTGRFVVTPSRSEILLRSTGYGAGWGAVAGATVLVVPGVVAFPDAAGLLLLLAPIAAAVGAAFGVVCGVAGGLALAIFRRHLASRGAIRFVAGAGAGLAPTALMVRQMASPVYGWHLGFGALTAVTASLAAALGPHAFFGPPRRRRRRAGSQPKRGGGREIVRQPAAAVDQPPAPELLCTTQAQPIPRPGKPM